MRRVQLPSYQQSIDSYGTPQFGISSHLRAEGWQPLDDVRAIAKSNGYLTYVCAGVFVVEERGTCDFCVHGLFHDSYTGQQLVGPHCTRCRSLLCVESIEEDASEMDGGA